MFEIKVQKTALQHGERRCENLKPPKMVKKDSRGEIESQWKCKIWYFAHGVLRKSWGENIRAQQRSGNKEWVAESFEE